jgi:4-hydroxy-tetrahydrodipicolinate synthase
MFKPHGMIAAIPTPMNADGSINYKGFEPIVEHLIENGMHGLLVDGSCGEYSLKTMDERKETIKVVCEIVNGRIPVIAGTSCHRTEDTIKLTNYAAEIGASNTLIINPYYMHTSRQGIIDYYKTIAENSSVGILIYNYPGATGIELDPELIYEISQIEGIVGIKNTTDGQHTSKLIALTKDNPNFSVLTGFEHLILPTLALGGQGAIGVVHNLAPKKIVELYDLVVKENNIKAATELNTKLLDLYNAIEEEVIPGTIKAGLEVLGLPGGPSRAPLVSASDTYRKKIKKILKELGELYVNNVG